MKLAHLDAVTQHGVIEGWACDPDQPTESLALAVLLEDGTEVAAGRAELFREDLMEAQLRYGWCAFRLRAALAPDALAAQTLRLVEPATGAVLHVQPSLPIRHATDRDCETVAAVVAEDPTCCARSTSWRGAGILFTPLHPRGKGLRFIPGGLMATCWAGRPIPVGFASYEEADAPRRAGRPSACCRSWR